MDQRNEFVREYRRGLYSMTELAERYGISRKTGYALVRRDEDADSAWSLYFGSILLAKLDERDMIIRE